MNTTQQMAQTPENIVRHLLRDSEDVKIALETHVPNEEDLETVDLSEESSSSGYEVDDLPRQNTPRKRRIIAVVTHLDSATGDEQAWFVPAYFSNIFVFGALCHFRMNERDCDWGTSFPSYWHSLYDDARNSV